MSLKKCPICGRVPNLKNNLVNYDGSVISYECGCRELLQSEDLSEEERAEIWNGYLDEVKKKKQRKKKDTSQI